MGPFLPVISAIYTVSKSNAAQAGGLVARLEPRTKVKASFVAMFDRVLRHISFGLFLTLCGWHIPTRNHHAHAHAR